VRGALLVARRELLVERAQPDGLIAALTLVALLVLLESLLVGPGVARQGTVAAALFWLAVVLAALLATTRSFDRELEDDALEGVLALPGGRDALYAGKVLALAALLGIVSLAGGALAVVLLSLEVALPWHLALSGALGVAALPPALVLYVALTLRLRARAMLVPVLALPTLVPQLVAASGATAASLAGDPASALAWSGLLAASALISAVAGLTIGPSAIE
jgi:heme exporter protein B